MYEHIPPQGQFAQSARICLACHSHLAKPQQSIISAFGTVVFPDSGAMDTPQPAHAMNQQAVRSSYWGMGRSHVQFWQVRAWRSLLKISLSLEISSDSLSQGEPAIQEAIAFLG